MGVSPIFVSAAHALLGQSLWAACVSERVSARGRAYPTLGRCASSPVLHPVHGQRRRRDVAARTLVPRVLDHVSTRSIFTRVFFSPPHEREDSSSTRINGRESRGPRPVTLVPGRTAVPGSRGHCFFFSCTDVSETKVEERRGPGQRRLARAARSSVSHFGNARRVAIYFFFLFFFFFFSPLAF